MATSTLAPNDEDQDERLNPGQQDADRRFGDLAKAEEKGTFDDIANNYDGSADPSQEDENIKKLQNNEALSSPDANWVNNTDKADSGKKKSKLKGFLKKAGPATGITGILGVGGFILLALTSPSLLIVQMKEVMTGKFNTQLSSMETRTNKLLYSKMQNSTKGFCSSGVNIRCKYSSMSDKQVAKFKAAGIEVVPHEGTTVTGRVKPASYKFNNVEITPNKFLSVANSDAEFRSALKQAYNPKYAGFVGKAWANVSARFKISKQPPELNAADGKEEAKTRLNQLASEGRDDDVGSTRVIADDANCEGAQCTGIDGDEANTVNSTAEAVEGAKAGTAAADVRSKLSGLNSGAATSVFKATGALDTACQAYGAMTALSYASKAIRAAQLVRYSMVFLTVADTIKAGESPDPADVALLGTILTTTLKSSSDSSKTILGSATDSFGYKYAAFGDVSGPEKSMMVANRFSAGGGFVGSMSSVSNSILSALGGNRRAAHTTCKTLANPLVAGGSLVLGVAMLFIPGVNVAKVALQGAAAAAFTVALAVLPSLLADIVAGTVTNDIVGEESGNAITSGSGALLSDALAGQNGNAPMSKTDAIAYNNLQTETTNQYIADELQETSPFDPTNPHTFVGSIAASLLPLQSSSNPLTVVGSLLTNSFASVVPKSNALSQADYAKSLTICQDLDVIESGYAADPFCNVIRGIPPKYLNKDPITVVEDLIDKNAITEDGTMSGEYQAFVSKCMTSGSPFGYSVPANGFDPKEAEDCIIKDSNADYYLHYIDQIVDAGLDGDYGDAATVAEPTTGGALPSGSAAELAQLILSSGNVTDRTGQLNQIISDSRTNISPGILQVIAALSSSNKFTISSMKRDQALGVGAGSKSFHLQGKAADISGSAGVNGVSFGYNGHNPTVQAFIDAAAAAMPEGCEVGVPNQAYVNATKPKVKSGCVVFVDTGTAAHIHLAVKGDG